VGASAWCTNRRLGFRHAPRRFLPGSRLILIFYQGLTNRGAANDVRLDSFRPAGPDRAGKDRVVITSRDPGRFPVPVAATIPPGGKATFEVWVDFTGAPDFFHADFEIRISANGGRSRTMIKS
jgi:hypothetical protein